MIKLIRRIFNPNSDRFVINGEIHYITNDNKQSIFKQITLGDLIIINRHYVSDMIEYCFNNKLYPDAVEISETEITYKIEKFKNLKNENYCNESVSVRS